MNDAMPMPLLSISGALAADTQIVLNLGGSPVRPRTAWPKRIGSW